MVLRRIALAVVVVTVAALALPGLRDTALASAPAAKPKPKPKVPVVVKAYYPMNPSHQFIADYLTKFAKAHPSEVDIEIIDYQKTAGRKRWEKSGLSCAGLIINGKSTWDIKRGKRVDRVAFEKKMDVFWGRDDFELLVKQLVTESKAKAKRK